MASGTRARRCVDLQAHDAATSCSTSPGSISTSTRPSSRSSSTDAREQRDRVTADADVAVEQQRARQRPGAGDPVEHGPFEHVDAATRAPSRDARRDVDAQRDDAALGRARRRGGRDRTRRRAPAPRRGRARACSAALAAAEPAVDGQVEHAAVGRAAGVPGRSAIVTPRRASSVRAARANRDAGIAAADRACVGERVDVAQARRGPRRGRPSVRRRARCCRAGARRSHHRTPVEHARIAARARRWSSSRRRRRGPSTASQPGREQRRARGRADAGVSWGVSMPDDQHRAADVGERARRAGRRGRRRPGERRRTRRAPTSPARRRARATRGRTRARSTASSVSASAAAASAAACSGVHGGHRRVLTRPGTGAFASTTIGRSSQRRPHVADGADVPPTRAGDLRAPDPRRGSRRAPRRCASRRPPRAGPSRAASRNAGRGARGRAASAPRGAHRAEVGRARRRCGGDRAREHAVRDPGCQRPRARRRRASGAEHEVGVAREHRSDDRGEIGAVERAVAVHERNDVGGGRDSPAKQAAPKPRRGSATTCGAVSRARRRLSRRVEPLSTTIGVTRGGCPRAHRGSRALRRAPGGSTRPSARTACGRRRG